MTNENAVGTDSTEGAAEVSTQDSSTLDGGDKRTITPAERWALICENVYTRAQKRGFVGGNPLQDLADASQEIDAAYETDFDCVFSLTSSTEITEQLKSLYAGYGFAQEDLEKLLDGHQEGLEKLAAMNRDLLDSTSALVEKQTKLLQDVASESAKTLQSFTQGRLRPEGVFKIAELSMQAFSNALMGFQGSTKSAPNTSEHRLRETSDSALLQGAVVSDYEGQSATQLMDAPVTALKGISDSLKKRLEDEFGIGTIREMAANKHAEWARAVVRLADATPAARTLADSRIAEARDIGESQASLLKQEFGVETVRDLGSNHLFNAARAIFMLAESDG
jgi:hypothetical protein